MDLEKAVQEAVKKLEAENLDAFEVAGIAENSLVVEAKRQTVDSFRRTSTRGIAIRVVRSGHMGWSATSDIDHKAVGKAVQQAMGSMQVATKSEEALIVMPQDPEGDFIEQVGRSIGEISDDEKIGMAMKVESAAIAADTRIVRVRNPRYEEVERHMTVVNSNGISVGARRGLVSCMLQAVASDGASSESAYEFDFSPRYEDLDVEETARRAAKRAVMKLGATGIGSALLPVVFENRAASSMVGLLAPSFFADNVQRGKSRLVGRMGEGEYSPLITVVDDGLMSGGIGSFPFDGEGIPQRRTVLIRDGCVGAWLYDGPRAKRDGALSTGNCHRSKIGKLPSIGVTNCFLKAGSIGAKELYSGIGKGVLITDLLGVHTANSISGDFSLGAEGFLVEGGGKVSPVRGITIAGNVHDLFRRIEGVGDDLKFFGKFGSPSILVKGLMLSG